MKANNFKLIEKGNKSQIFLYEENVVLKMVDIKFGKQITHLRNEFELMKTLSHPNILKVLGLKHNIPIKDCRRDVLLMEYANAGSFLSVLKSKPELKQKKTFAIQLLDALSYLHLSQQVAHRDIKLDNILVRKQANGCLTALISDFGFAIQNSQKTNQSSDLINKVHNYVLPTSEELKNEQSGLLKTTNSNLNSSNSSQKRKFLANSYKGTKRGYMAPELHKLLEKSSPYDPFKVDVFSLGVVLFCLFFQHLPFQLSSQKDPLYKLIQEHQFVQFWHKHRVDEVNFPNHNLQELKSLLQNMLQCNPDKRFSICEVVQSLFSKSTKVQLSVLKKVSQTKCSVSQEGNGRMIVEKEIVATPIICHTT